MAYTKGEHHMKMPFFNPKGKKSFRFSELLPSWNENRNAKWNDWETDRAIREGLKASTYVYACINAIAKAVSSVPWYVYKETKAGEWEVIHRHPLELLIDKPTPFHSRKDLMTGIVQHLYLGGNSVFTKVRGGETVAELWQMPPDAIKIFPSRKDFISHYEYNKDGIKRRIETNDILHTQFNDPSNPYWGISPLQAGARLVDSDIEAVKFQKISLQNRAITDGVFSFEHPLTEQQWTEARKMVREQHQGAENARTPWVLGAGANWQQMSLSPVEMDFLNSRKFNREEICSLFQVPPPIVGIMDTSTYNNIETARKIFWQDTIISLLEDLKDSFNLGLTPEFGTGIELGYDVSNVQALQTSTQEKITNAKDLFSMGVPFNMINQKLELGFDQVEGGDIGYLPSQLMPSDFLSNPPQEDDPQTGKTPPTNDEEDKPKGLTPQLTKDQKSIAYKGINLKTDEQKDFYSGRIDRMRNSWVTNLARKSAKLFDQESQVVINSLKNNQDWKKAIDRNKSTWETFLSASYSSILEEIGQQHFNDLIGSVDKSNKAGLSDFFNPYTQLLRSFITTLAGTKVTMVTDWTKQVIGAIVYEANEENLSMDELARKIKGEFEDFSRYRAYRIARTETQNALGFAQHEAGKQAEKALGQKLIGEWWTSLDSRVRESHQELHGEKSPLGEKFSNGLYYAGEYTQTETKGENINCRCVILHHFE
jgi:HK97 family phage portal protein